MHAALALGAKALDSGCVVARLPLVAAAGGLRELNV
jgi:hypothetical protein